MVEVPTPIGAGDGLTNRDGVQEDFYDAAAFSAVIELSEWSVLNNSNSIKIPDFTAGVDKTGWADVPESETARERFGLGLRTFDPGR